MLTRAAAQCVGFAVLVASACRGPDAHVQLLELRVTNLPRAVEFYQAVFGWEVSRPDSFYVILAAPPVAIGLTVHDSVAVVGSPTIVIAVRDLEAVFGRVRPHGGVIRQPIQASWRGRQFRLADPDGNELVVWSDRPPSSAAR